MLTSRANCPFDAHIGLEVTASREQEARLWLEFHILLSVQPEAQPKPSNKSTEKVKCKIRNKKKT